MTTIDVCLDIEAQNNPSVFHLQALGELIERGTMLVRIEAGVSDDQPIQVHLQSLTTQLDSALLSKPLDIGGAQVWLVIGAFVYDLSYTVSIPAESLKPLIEYFPNMVVDIIYYKCDPDSSREQK